MPCAPPASRLRRARVASVLTEDCSRTGGLSTPSVLCLDSRRRLELPYANTVTCRERAWLSLTHAQQQRSDMAAHQKQDRRHCEWADQRCKRLGNQERIEPV